MEKSKLRKKESLPLDAKYGGIAVRRKDLASDSDDDFLAGGVHQSEDEDPFAEPKTRPSLEDAEISSGDKYISQSDAHEGNDSDEISDDDNDEVDSHMEAQDGLKDDTDDGYGDDLSEEGSNSSSGDASQSDENAIGSSGPRRDLRALLANDSKELASSLSQAAIADATKGRAVKKQYQTFDRILDARMKLQKAFAASDELETMTDAAEFASDAEKALEAARESARRVFSTITSFRDSIANATIPESQSRKRKRLVEAESLEDLGAMWGTLDELEKEGVPTRRTIMDKWSQREKSVESSLARTRTRPGFQGSSTQADNLTAVLDVYISNEQEKYFRWGDENDGASANPGIIKFDDSVFYQTLLRDLITNRSATSSGLNELTGGVVAHKLHPSGNKQNKKNIDTKASKGRKIRYTVHEKLQNFMAAEGDTGRDTAMWTERGKNEFFGSLFGQDRALVEDSDKEDEAEVEALRLFRG